MAYLGSLKIGAYLKFIGVGPKERNCMNKNSLFSFDYGLQQQLAARQIHGALNMNLPDPDHGPRFTFKDGYIEITTKKGRKKTWEKVDFNPSNPLHLNAKLYFFENELRKKYEKLEEIIFEKSSRTPRFGWKK